MNENEKIKGNIKISEDVICSIVAVAADETEGVASVAAAAGIDILNKKNQKNIKIHISENTITIDMSILVKYGVIINDVATKLQETVSNAVESMTGMEVTAVNVSVSGISFDDKKDENK